MGCIKSGEKEPVPYKLITDKEGGGEIKTIARQAEVLQVLPSLPPPHPPKVSDTVRSVRNCSTKMTRWAPEQQKERGSAQPRTREGGLGGTRPGESTNCCTGTSARRDVNVRV